MPYPSPVILLIFVFELSRLGTIVCENPACAQKKLNLDRSEFSIQKCLLEKLNPKHQLLQRS